MAREVVSLSTQRWIPLAGGMGRLMRLVRTDYGALDVLVELEDHQSLRMSYAEFCLQAAAAAVKPMEDALVIPQTGEWDNLPQEVRDRHVRRARDLLEVRTGSPTGFLERAKADGSLDPRYDPNLLTLNVRVANKASELRDRGEQGHSRSQIFRQLARFEQDGLMGLVHDNRLRGSDSDIPDDLAEALEKVLDRRAASAKTTTAALAAITRGELTDMGLDLTDYSASTWARIVAEASRGRGLHRNAVSRRTRQNKPQRVYGRRTVSRPGEMIQIDATTTTIHCFFPDTGWGRATILTAIDVYSRCVLALRVLAGSPNSRDVGLLLWDIGRPTVTRSGYPYELRLWHGMPELVTVSDAPASCPSLIGNKPAVTPTTIVMDHGRENESLHLQSAAAECGISITYSPPGAPHTKGVIESLHNTWDAIQQLLPANKGASPANHPRGVEDAAALTVGDLHDALWEYILTVYHHREHSGLRDPADPVLRATPAEIFERYLEVGGEIAIPTDPWRMLAFLSREQCAVQDYGINLHRRIYNSPALLELRGHLQRGVGSAAQRLTVYYDRYDISRVYARHPGTGAWMMIPRWDPERLAVAPYSEVLTDVARRALIAGGTPRPSATDLQIAEARFHAAWAAGRFTDRREQRLAAVERARAEAYAHDLGDATDEVRGLAFPPEPPSVDPHTYVPFDLPPEPEDDDVLIYDDIDLEAYLP